MVFAIGDKVFKAGHPEITGRIIGAEKTAWTGRVKMLKVRWDALPQTVFTESPRNVQLASQTVQMYRDGLNAFGGW